MKIHEVIDRPSIMVSNQENSFIRRHGKEILIASLSDAEKWIAQQLVRKGVYFLANDSKTMVLDIGHKNGD